MNRFGVRAALLVSALLFSFITPSAHGQSRLYTVIDSRNNTHKYALLNGEKIALYINERGDLGAPYFFDSTVKPPAYLVNGVPYVADDGSVRQDISDPSVPGNCLSALFSQTPTSNPSLPLGAQVRAKSEYIGLNTQGTVEEQGVRLNGQWIYGQGFPTPTLTVSGDSARVKLSATSAMSLGGACTLFQTVAIQEVVGKLNVVHFTVKFINNSTSPLTGLQYARLMNPNQGAIGWPATQETQQGLGTPADPNAFAIDSVAGHHLGVGVLPNSSSSASTVGTTILSLPANQGNAFTFFNDVDNIVSNANRAVLRTPYTVNNLVYYPADMIDGFTGAVTSVTDYRTTHVDPGFMDGDATLVLLSPRFDLAPSASTTFNFYYYFDTNLTTNVRFDFNSDGNADILLRYDSGDASDPLTGAFFGWLMQRINLITTMPILPTIGLDWRVAACPDWDGDGQVDILWQNVNTGDVGVWYMNLGTYLYGDTLATGIPLEWQLVGTPDLNGDGQRDLLWQNINTGEIAYWLFNGNKKGLNGTIGIQKPGYNVVATFDTGVGKTEIVFQNTDVGEVTYWNVNGNTKSVTFVSAGTIAQNIPQEWKVVGCPDLNGDGKADLLWRNTQDTTYGDISVWYMNANNTVLGTATVAPSVPLVWKVVGIH